MKTVYLERGDSIYHAKNKPWVVSAVVGTVSIEVEDDIEAPVGWLWDGDSESGRPTFREEYWPGITAAELKPSADPEPPGTA